MLPEVADILTQTRVVHQPIIEAWRTAENAHAESNSKGVVGKTGTKIPTTPNANASTPIMVKKIFTPAKVINHTEIAIKPQKIVTFALK